ncbi:MAG: M23 family metallopeptidase [Bacteroidota bacterium]
MRAFYGLVLLGIAAICGPGCTSEPSAPRQRASSVAYVSSPPPVVPPQADGFDFPVGPPDARGYYNAQKFGENGHLGEDWNGVGGGNSDLGDPVYAAATGVVAFAEDLRGGWGNVIRVEHNLGTVARPQLVETLYGHLDTIWVKAGDTVQRGQQIGTIGNAHGAYWAHLHFELRDSVDGEIGGGYAGETTGFRDPSAFIRAHRPAQP